MRIWQAGLFIMVVAGIVACGNTQDVVKVGSKVTLTYSLDVENSQVVPADQPERIEIVIGQGEYPPMFERALVGLRKGQKKVIQLSPEQAFGPVRQELFVRIDKTQLPENISEGMMIGPKDASEPKSGLRVAKILDDGTVVLDRNHPLAGKTLVYRVSVESIS